MSNLGLHLAMRDAGISMRATAVGDRYVLEELRAGGYSLGGEQSGHVVLPAYATTGDGLLTALRLMARMADTRSELAELASVVTVLPQVLENVRVVDKEAVASSDDVPRGRRGRGAGAGRHRPRAAAPVGHRAAGARDGRGRDGGAGQGQAVRIAEVVAAAAEVDTAAARAGRQRPGVPPARVGGVRLGPIRRRIRQLRDLYAVASSARAPVVSPSRGP